MFKINDTVIHSGMGVCTVTVIIKMSVGKNTLSYLSVFFYIFKVSFGFTENKF